MSTTLMAAFVAETAIITYRDVKGGFDSAPSPLPMPLPSQYVAPAIVFGALGLVPDSSRLKPMANAIGWGLVVATLLNLWQPGGKAVKVGTPLQQAVGAGIPGSVPGVQIFGPPNPNVAQ